MPTLFTTKLYTAKKRQHKTPFLIFCISSCIYCVFYAFVVLSGFCKLKFVFFSLLPLVASPSNVPAFRLTATSAVPALA